MLWEEISCDTLVLLYDTLPNVNMIHYQFLYHTLHDFEQREEVNQDPLKG